MQIPFAVRVLVVITEIVLFIEATVFFAVRERKSKREMQEAEEEFQRLLAEFECKNVEDKQ